MCNFRVLMLLAAILFSAYFFTGCNEQKPDNLKQEIDNILPEQHNTGQQAKPENKLTIGVSVLRMDNIFIADMQNAMEVKAKELGMKVIISDGQNSAERQVSQVENFIAQMVDVIILNPASMDECKPAVEAANRAKIPIMTVNTLVANQDKCAAFVGSDAQESGRLEMEYAAKLLKGKGNIVILRGQNGHDAEIGRRKGTQEILDKNPGIKVLHEQSANWSRDEGTAIVENWLRNEKNIDAVVSQNDEMALGAVRAIEDAKLQGRILVFGIDAIPEALSTIRTGKMAGTVFQDAKAQGSGAIRTALKIAAGEKVQSKIYIPYTLVTSDDVEKYKK